MSRVWIFMLASLSVVWGVAIWAYFRLLASTRKRDSTAPGKIEEPLHDATVASRPPNAHGA